MKKIILKKIAKINNFFVYHFNKINEFGKIINHKFKNISSFNKYFILIITSLFLYLFYLSIPSLYDKGFLQTQLNKMINEEFNINISLSSDLTYSILPKPHIEIKNVKIYTDNLDSPKELGQIKKIKIFISQKNFFEQKNIEIKSITINNANFSIRHEDIGILRKFIEKKLSKKKLKIRNSNFFYIDNNDDVISIFPISKLDLYFDEENSKNIINSQGLFFNIPYRLKWNKDFIKNIYSTFFKINKLNLRVENFTEKKNSLLLMKNFIFFRNTEIQTNISSKKNLIKIKSNNDSKVKNNSLSYNGLIELNPFHLNMDVNLKKLNFNKSIFHNNLLHGIFELRQLYNKSLSLYINLQIENLIKNKLFDSSRILITVKNGNINFNNTVFNGKMGNLNVVNSRIENVNDDLIFDANFVFNIFSKSEFYRLFQINKKNRKKINNVYFDIKYNLTKNKFEISNLIFDPGKIKAEEELTEMLDSYIKSLKINNWIDFKNFVQKIFVDYYDG